MWHYEALHATLRHVNAAEQMIRALRRGIPFRGFVLKIKLVRNYSELCPATLIVSNKDLLHMVGNVI